MKKAYYLLYFKLCKFFELISEDGWEKVKAMITVNGICALILVELLVWYAVIFKLIISIPKFLFVIPVLIIVIANYNFLTSKENWNKYESEFKNYTKHKNKIINFLILIFILIVIGSLILAFYQMSLIDWNKYR